MKLIYPAYVIRNEDKEGFIVTVPDIDCMTEAETLSEAITLSIETASDVLMKELESGNPVPRPTPIEHLQSVPEGFITMLMLDINAYADKIGASVVKKSLSVPRWLNSFAESHKIDYSELVQKVLTSLYEEQINPETALTGRPLLQINQRR